MSDLSILTFPDPRLRTEAALVEEVDDDIRLLLDQMRQKMYDTNGIGLALGADLYEISWLWDIRFLSGVSLFVIGAIINIRSDGQLLRLRQQSASDGYLQPDIGLHRHVAAPNYLGEIIQWCGWALAAWSWAGLLFALYTIANLAPRASAHLKWYRATFPDYPENRKALIPFVW